MLLSFMVKKQNETKRKPEGEADTWRRDLIHGNYHNDSENEKSLSLHSLHLFMTQPSPMRRHFSHTTTAKIHSSRHVGTSHI